MLKRFLYKAKKGDILLVRFNDVMGEVKSTTINPKGKTEIFMRVIKCQNPKREGENYTTLKKYCTLIWRRK